MTAKDNQDMTADLVESFYKDDSDYRSVAFSLASRLVAAEDLLKQLAEGTGMVDLPREAQELLPRLRS